VTRTFLQGDVLESVPVFPLPQVVLFPRALMPLHVFEPRYRAMTRDALAGDRLIVLAQIPDDFSTDERGQPEFCRIATVGEIVQSDPLDDGRFNILLEGRARVRLEELPLQPPYRRARGTVLATTCTSECRVEARALALTAAEFVSHVRDSHPSFEFALDASSPPGLVADQVGHYLILDATERQQILETLDDTSRVHRCLETLMRQGADLGGRDTLH
jgi:Lon protease-like protein